MDFRPGHRKEAKLSTYHFAHLFCTAMGESLHQFVIRQRVEAAKEFLLHGTLPLPEITAQVGFADQSHLGRHCKALLGVTPKMLLKERKNRRDTATSFLYIKEENR